MNNYENRDLENLENEIWKDIKEYDGDYQISNFARIKSFKRYKNGKILLQYKDSDGYLVISLYKNGKGKPKLIHDLEFETFNNCKLKKDECVHHLNENPSDNILDNFQLMTNSEHRSLHMSGENHPNFGKHLSEETKQLMREKKIGIYSGENNPQVKLEEWKVKAIYQISNSSIIKQLKITQKEIAKMFGVHLSTISAIKTGKTWKHIKCKI